MPDYPFCDHPCTDYFNEGDCRCVRETITRAAQDYDDNHHNDTEEEESDARQSDE